MCEKPDNEPSDKQYQLVYDHLKLLQSSMDKYDNMSTEIRKWAVTLWAATISAGTIEGFEIESRSALIVISIFVVFAMGMYDGMYKTFRNNYKDTRNDIAIQIRKDKCGLSSISFPEQPEDDQLIKKAIRAVFHPHIGFVYLILIGTSVAILVLRYYGIFYLLVGVLIIAIITLAIIMLKRTKDKKSKQPTVFNS